MRRKRRRLRPLVLPMDRIEKLHEKIQNNRWCAFNTNIIDINDVKLSMKDIIADLKMNNAVGYELTVSYYKEGYQLGIKFLVDDCLTDFQHIFITNEFADTLLTEYECYVDLIM